MTTTKILFTFFCILISTVMYSQTTATASDSTLLRLKITTFQDKEISTTVYFENTVTHNKLSVKTGKNGKLEYKFKIGSNYIITIRDSEDSYEYTIPDADGFPLDFTFKYNLKEKSQTTCAIRVFNNSSLKSITLNAKNNSRLTADIKNDTANFVLELDEDYTVQLKNTEIKNNRIRIPGTNQMPLSYVIYFTDDKHADLILIDSLKSVINVVYKNLYDEPVNGESIVVKGKKYKAHYSLVTASNGSALAILPSGDYYTVSLKYFPDVFKINIETENNIVVANNLLLIYPGSKEFEKQKQEEAKKIADRDSIYLLFEKIKELNYVNLKKDLAEKIPGIKSALAKDPKYFEKHNDVVCAVLIRNKWASKMIVTDVTGSMYPYMRQVALWHSLEFMDKLRSDYVFFNDGDNKPDNQKIIGKTGGIYSCLRSAPDSVIKVMYTAMQNGGGGDAPENNIEALIAADKARAANATLILIADNFSAIKDRILIPQIETPVRIVVCGSNGIWVHPDYLELAFKTGGSVHTIEEDIFNLSQLHDGETIKIGGAVYKFSGGRFFRLENSL